MSVKLKSDRDIQILLTHNSEWVINRTGMLIIRCSKWFLVTQNSISLWKSEDAQSRFETVRQPNDSLITHIFSGLLKMIARLLHCFEMIRCSNKLAYNRIECKFSDVNEWVQSLVYLFTHPTPFLMSTSERLATVRHSLTHSDQNCRSEKFHFIREFLSRWF